MSLPVARAITPLLVAALVGACGARSVLYEEVSPAGNGDGGTPRDSATRADVSSGRDGASCVDVTLTAADLACATDSDCALAESGQVCTGSCGCGDTPMNSAAAARVAAETASIVTDACPCVAVADPVCTAGQCTRGCLGGCPADGGATGEGGATAEGGTPADGGATCVNIDPTTYDQSCRRPRDCMLIVAGDVCDGACSCGTAAINVSGRSEYESATSGITLVACHCAPLPVDCVGNTCVVPGAPP